MTNGNWDHGRSCRFYKAGDWELYIFYTNRGYLGIEGQFGVLLWKGEMCPPIFSEFNEIETGLGTMKYYGLDKPIPSSPTGWLFADVSKIPNTCT